MSFGKPKLIRLLVFVFAIIGMMVLPIQVQAEDVSSSVPSIKEQSPTACPVNEQPQDINGTVRCVPFTTSAQNLKEAQDLQKKQEVKNKEYEKQQGKDTDVTSMDWSPVDDEGHVYDNPKWHPFRHPLVTLVNFPKWGLAKYATGITSIDSQIFALNGDAGTWQNFTYMPDFQSDVLNKFISFFTMASWIMFAFGVVFAITETGIAYENGQGNAVTTVKNILVAFLFTSFCTYVMAHLFLWTIDVANQLGNFALADTSIGAMTAQCLVAIFAATTVLGPIGILLILIFFIIEITKYHINVLRRGIIYLSLTAKSCLIPFNLVRGITGNAQGFIDQFFSFLIGMVLQIFIFRFGLSLFSKGTVQYMMAGMAFMISSDSVFGMVGSPSASSVDPIGDLHNVLHISNSMEGIQARHGESMITNAAQSTARAAIR